MIGILQEDQATYCHIYVEGLFWSHVCSQAVNQILIAPIIFTLLILWVFMWCSWPLWFLQSFLSILSRIPWARPNVWQWVCAPEFSPMTNGLGTGLYRAILVDSWKFPLYQVSTRLWEDSPPPQLFLLVLPPFTSPWTLHLMFPYIPVPSSCTESLFTLPQEIHPTPTPEQS